MKYSKRILSILLAALLTLSIAALPPARAAPGDEIRIVNVGSGRILETFVEGAWWAMPVPFWASGDGSVAYCLESDKDSPINDGYGMAEALYNESVSRGIRAILLHGWPNDDGGLDPTAARCATQAALWSWMFEAGGVGENSYARENIRAPEGRQAVYDYYASLLDYAYAGADRINGSASLSHAILADDGSGRLVGIAAIYVNAYQGYRIDESKLPPGVTAAGVTYRNGDTITITAPMSYLGQTIRMEGAIVLLDTRSADNVFWYTPERSNLQKMAVFNLEVQDVLWDGLVFTSELPKGALRINKIEADTSVPLAGAVFEIRTPDGALVDTVSSNAQGQAMSKQLPHGDYLVTEITAPPGFIRDTQTHPVSLAFGELWVKPLIAEITITNQPEPQTGRVTIIKTNADPSKGDYSLAGAVFDIFNAEGELVDTVTIDAAGEAQSRELPLGDYVVTERVAPYGFILNQSAVNVQQI